MTAEPKQGFPVSLRAVAQEMDLPNPDWTAYLNRRTGELFTVTDDDVRVADAESDDDLPDWRAELMPKVREVLASDDFLPLPSKYEIDDYRILERFCDQVSDARVRDDLQRAIRGKGAFGRFKALAQRCGLLEAWYAYRDRALEEIAAGWLEANGIAYIREVVRVVRGKDGSGV